MLDTDTKRCIDSCRDILVGKVPDPKSQVEQITIALTGELSKAGADAAPAQQGGRAKDALLAATDGGTAFRWQI